MEENVQRVFAVLISVIMFFFLPMYITFEKKDDISYALALKITTSFVENVRSKGYITSDMYDDFVDQLTATDNTYDISLEHISKKYYPAIFKRDATNSRVEKFEYIFDSSKLAQDGYFMGYDEVEELHTEKQIFEVWNRDDTQNPVYWGMGREQYMAVDEGKIPAITNFYGSTLQSLSANTWTGSTQGKKVYTMNEGDQFNVIIKNKNTTVATVLFNSFTLGANAGNDTKVYINYGGTIKNEEYRENLADPGADLYTANKPEEEEEETTPEPTPTPTPTEDRTAPSITITTDMYSAYPTQTWSYKITDAGSGVDLSKSKWIVTKENTQLGVNNSIWGTAPSLGSETGTKTTQTLDPLVPYYIHVLGYDKAGNAVEIISSKIYSKGWYEMNASSTSYNAYVVVDSRRPIGSITADIMANGKTIHHNSLAKQWEDTAKGKACWGFNIGTKDMGAGAYSSKISVYYEDANAYDVITFPTINLK